MKEKIRNIEYLIKVLWKEDKQLFVVLIFDIFITTAAKYPMILFPKYILDAFISGREFRYALTLIIFMVSSEFTLALVSNYISRKQKEHSKRLEFQLHTNVTNKTLSMQYEKLLDSETYDNMYLASDIANGNNFMKLIDNMKGLFSNIILLISMIYLIAQVDYRLLFITFVVVIINALTDSKIQNQLIKTKKETSKSIRELEYIGKLAWHIDYAKEVRLFHTGSLIHNKYYNLNEKVLQRIFGDYKIENKGKAINTIAGSIQTIILYILLGYKLLNKIITVGDFTLFMNAVNTFKGALSGGLRNIIEIEAHSKYFSAYMAYMKEDDSLKKEIENQEIIPAEYSQGFYFKNVSYKYSGQSNFAIENVTVFIQKGEKISLVGENGAGKTTFVLLLLKLITPSSGHIYYNGIDINEIDNDTYWKEFSTVFQDYQLYNFSIMENITLCDILGNENEILSILKRCGMFEAISALEKGINTQVGHEFEKDGVDFSGGQRQRIAIARAIYKNGKNYILDEPTSALDAKAENEIFQLMNELANTNTAIFISHRLYSAKFCDRILFFENGEIAESGSHKSLMDKKGKYFEMFEMQAHYYEGENENES